MAGFFGKKDVKEELREQNKVLRGANREIDREKTQIEREKKRLVSYRILLACFFFEFLFEI